MAKDTYRYKPHDEVYLADNLQSDTRYYMRSGPKDGSCSVAYSSFSMQRIIERYGDRALHIKKRVLGFYYIEEDGYPYKFTDEMLRKRGGLNFMSLL